MKPLRAAFAGISTALFLTVAVFAADPTGTWKWTAGGPNGQSREATLNLALKDGQLTGAMTGMRGEMPISEGTFKDDEVAFSVVRERDGNKFVSKYTGKLEGDTIKGSILMPGRDGGEGRKQDWTATRSKGDDKAAAKKAE